ncbi:hypothetical protein PEX1_092960 [Penicillium expansum]|uniref:Uncharacterized protein n=1 Tax=Penicillium expansum TaxID=27334 RepID=A0A0A2ICS9_PENEN|nr:hypothetical protein PEX2_056470 [Penicillium expansum]KGO40233.1 hypothetical protein PEXP_036170 [Penicillium expansum]KGO53004.1 hypothetical protein PEX2_056470 [Penicillium expansum]KGO73473.1 hypothetical protein PEX1_092960 [Penicillium expansum]
MDFCFCFCLFSLSFAEFYCLLGCVYTLLEMYINFCRSGYILAVSLSSITSTIQECGLAPLYYKTDTSHSSLPLSSNRYFNP